MAIFLKLLAGKLEVLCRRPAKKERNRFRRISLIFGQIWVVIFPPGGQDPPKFLDLTLKFIDPGDLVIFRGKRSELRKPEVGEF